MKKTAYELSNSDVDAILAALSAMPSYSFSKEQISLMLPLCLSVGEKLSYHRDLSPQDMSLVALAVDSAYKALRNEMTLDETDKEPLKPFFFVYNKLLPVLSPYLDM